MLSDTNSSAPTISSDCTEQHDETKFNKMTQNHCRAALPTTTSGWHSHSCGRRKRSPRATYFITNMRAMYWSLSQLYLVFAVALITFNFVAADFIDKVECEKDKMVVYINEGKVQEDYPAIGVDRYSVYVHQFKDTCNDHGIVSQSNSLKSKRFVVPLNAGCGINSQADNTMGIHKEWLVYQATVRLEAIKPRSPDGRILEQRVKCVYSTSHQATASSSRLIVKGSENNINNNMISSRQSPILGAGTVEGSAPPIENFIELFFASPDPKFSPLPEATIGDAVRIVLRMSHNVAYSAMKPEFCIISNKPYANRNDPDFRELIVVNGGCSVQSTPPLIPKMVYRASMTAGEPEIYYSKFTMFKMGDYNELHAMCNVKLCISSSEKACDTTQPRGCFESVRRRKRSPDRWAESSSPTSQSLLRSPATRHNEPLALSTASSPANNSFSPHLSLLNKQLLMQHPLVRLSKQLQSSTQYPLTQTTAMSNNNKLFNPDLLTVSGRLHVNQQNAAATAALAGSQLCFHSVTFSVMAAILAWLFVLSFCCVILLACLLRRQKRRLKKEASCSHNSNRSQPCASSSSSSSNSRTCTRASNQVSESCSDNNKTTHDTLEQHHYQTFDARLSTHKNKLPANASQQQQHTLLYSIPHTSTRYCGTQAALRGRYSDDDSTMLKLRQFPHHQSLLRRQSLATASIISPLATTITAHNRRHHHQHHHQNQHQQRHHTLKPTSSASSSSASSASSALPASPSPFPTLTMCNSNNNNNMHNMADLNYDILG